MMKKLNKAKIYLTYAEVQENTSAKGIFSLICEICGSKKSRIHKE